jgi:hypothetical protein
MVLQLGADEANGKSLLGNSPFKVWFEFIFAPVACSVTVEGVETDPLLCGVIVEVILEVVVEYGS